MLRIEKVGAVSSSRMAAAIRVYPELRRVYPEPRRPPVFSRLLFHPDRAHTVSRPANRAKLNRQIQEVEHLATSRKQTSVICSNRQKFQLCLDEISTPLFSVGALLAAPATDAWLTCTDRKNGCRDRFSQFLPGSGLRVEFAVTHSKQSIAAFLPGSRFARNRNPLLRQGTAFYPELRRAAVPSSIQNPGVSTPEVRVTNTPTIHETTPGRSSLPGAVPLATSHLLALTQEGPLATVPYVRLGANSMPPRGKFIVLEGIDGSGKRTQLDMLARAFASRNVPFAQISFPRYDGFFGKLAARYLNGEFGSLEAVDAHFSALLYAGDRLEAKPKIESDLASGKMLLADRYVGSNLAHQGARVPLEKRTDFLQWLRHLEYQVYALPAEDLVIYLRVPPAEAHRLIGEKAARNYTKLQRDIHESNLAHLAATSEVYDQLAHQPNWLKIECYDASADALRSAESIHQEILAVAQAHATPTLRANK